MDHTARNYHAHGGSEWVVGGKLTFLPGATVEGAEGLFDLPPGGGAALPYIAESEAATVAALRADFNLAAIARSKFTGLPGRSRARAERFRVSCITSAVKPVGEKEVAVRQTPLTAMLSPKWMSSSTTLAWISSTALWGPLRMDLSVPISSTMPVNIYFATSLSKRKSGPSRVRTGFFSCNAWSGWGKPWPPTGDLAPWPPRIFGAI